MGNWPAPFSFSVFFHCLWVTSMDDFRGRGETRQINKISFQRLCSQRGLDVHGVGKGALGEFVAGSWKLLPLQREICVHYLQSQTNRSRVQVLECFCVTARKPPCLSSSITESVSDQTSFCLSLSLPLFLSLHVCTMFVFVYSPLFVLLCEFSSAFSMWMPGLDPEKHLGKSLASMQPYLKQVQHSYISIYLTSVLSNILAFTLYYL